MKGPVVLKLGGSAITVKEEPFKPDLRAIKRLAGEIASSGVRDLIVVHGGGSFGHPLADKYGIHEGFKHEGQLRGLAETHMAMEELNRLVVEAMIDEDLPAVPIPPISCFITKSGRIHRAFLEPVRALMGLKSIPVLYGDVAVDEEKGFCILSGDQIVAYLALELGASRVVLGLQVDGVFTKDPLRHPDAKLVEVLRTSELDKVEAGGSSAVDVTGGMRAKLAEMAPVAEAGIPVFLTNAKKPGNVLKALRGEKTRGTLLTR
ncbi:hypothetical protein B6U66_05110 [Candidatus Bathyarchaeota archaeon ex4484_135]|nr:MAG: hypothetical protein B6U66_05110 [Candidatus Bathyarchaeota archaeon ex4484_135]